MDKMIGHAKLKDGLCYLEANMVNKNLGSQGLISTTYQERKDQVWQRHRRLGHPPFSMLKKLLPSLFEDNNIENLGL